MAARSVDSLECVICNEDLLDPRPLPCGHSYCALPRPCLASLQYQNGRLRCAVCRADHNLKAEDIKPLYGIRDYLQGNANAELKTSCRFPCPIHPNKDFTFWCTKCNVTVCDDCIQELHDDHPVRSLKNYLIGKIETKFSKPFDQGIAEYKEDLEQQIHSTEAELDDGRLEVQQIEFRLSALSHQKDLLDQYSDISRSPDPDLIARQIQLLMKISETDAVDLRPNPSQNYERGSSIDAVAVSNSTVVANSSRESHKRVLHAKGRKCVSSSTQTEVSAGNSTAGELETCVPNFQGSNTTENSASIVGRFAAARSHRRTPTESAAPCREQQPKRRFVYVPVEVISIPSILNFST